MTHIVAAALSSRSDTAVVLDTVVVSGYADVMIKHWRLLAAPVGLALASLTGCAAATTGYCEAQADCERDVLGVDFDDAGKADDSVAVCAANKNTFIAALRANEEEVCHLAATATEAYLACVGQAFADGDDGCDAVNPASACEDEYDDWADAVREAGDECSENEG